MSDPREEHDAEEYELSYRSHHRFQSYPTCSTGPLGQGFPTSQTNSYDAETASKANLLKRSAARARLFRQQPSKLQTGEDRSKQHPVPIPSCQPRRPLESRNSHRRWFHISNNGRCSQSDSTLPKHSATSPKVWQDSTYSLIQSGDHVPVATCPLLAIVVLAALGQGDGVRKAIIAVLVFALVTRSRV